MRLLLCALIAPLVFFSSCTSGDTDKTKSVSDSTDEYTIMSMTIDAELGPDSAQRHRIAPIFPGEKDSVVIAKYKHYNDSLLAVLDTTKFTAYIRTQTILSDTDRLSGLIDRRMFMNNFNGIDTAFITLMRQLMMPALPLPINTERLHSSFAYSFVPAPDDITRRKAAGLLHGFAGKVSLSRIAFDSNKNRACIYSAYWCGELCADGTVYFFEKKDGKWSIVGNRALWVS